MVFFLFVINMSRFVRIFSFYQPNFWTISVSVISFSNTDFSSSLLFSFSTSGRNLRRITYRHICLPSRARIHVYMCRYVFTIYYLSQNDYCRCKILRYMDHFQCELNQVWEVLRRSQLGLVCSLCSMCCRQLVLCFRFF